MTPLLLGHRGARATRSIPENTLASFELCLQHGCDGFEFDVRLSADGEAVVCHDASFRRMKIANTASENLALPTLENVLQQFAERAFLDIELKVTGLETRTLAELSRHPPQKGFVVSSFLPEVLEAIHDLHPAIPLGILWEKGDQFVPTDWVIPQLRLVHEDFVKITHDAGKKIMVWTVNRVEQMEQLAEWGVDAIISDETELMVRSF
jgi:glycerophosphoryl diester phosphodiesterase